MPSRDNEEPRCRSRSGRSRTASRTVCANQLIVQSTHQTAHIKHVCTKMVTENHAQLEKLFHIRDRNGPHLRGRSEMRCRKKSTLRADFVSRSTEQQLPLQKTACSRGSSAEVCGQGSRCDSRGFQSTLLAWGVLVKIRDSAVRCQK